ncbi:hypothetical protein Tco_0579360 [Tanacetum coccineum]
MEGVILSIGYYSQFLRFYDYEIWNDVKTAFLNGYLNAEVYMEQPEGASTPAEIQRMQNIPYASAVGSIIAIAIAKDHGVTKGARHFRAKVHYLRETIEMGDVKIEKVDTDDNLADPFTKALAFPKHSELTEKIGMIPATASTTLVVNKEFVPPLDMCSKIPWALSRINQIIAWPCPKDVANYQYICKPATPTPKWELLEYGGRFRKLYVRNT